MDVTAVIQMVQSTGFPIFVAVYCLIRLEDGMKKMTEVMTELKTIIRERN
jgi:hypothetical protein